MARDAGCQLPFTDEVPPTGSQGPHEADRQAPGARAPLGLRAGVRVNREPGCGSGSWIGTVGGEPVVDARGSGSPSCGGGEYPVLSFISASEFALFFNISFFPFLLP